jgi:hypothetical protein
MLVIGYHFDDSIYGQLYFEYGRPGDPEDRRIVSPQVEKTMLAHSPDAVLVLLEASPDVIRRRMRENPHQDGVLKEEHIELVIDRFREGFKYSLMTTKLTLDTSTSTVDDTLAEFVDKIKPHLSDVDRSRILAHRALRGDG